MLETVSASPSLPTVDGSLSFADSRRVVAVDPDARLLEALIRSWTAVAPRVPEPTDTVGPSGSESADGDPEETASVVDSTPSLSVLARKPVLDGVFDDFHARSRGSGLRERGLASLSILGTSQPNPLLVVDGDATVVVDAGDGWVPLGDRSPPPTSPESDLVAAYADRLADAPSYPLRTPSRRALSRAFTDRCDPTVAADLLTLLDAPPTPSRHDPCDHLVRAYLVGARHEVVNYDLRRASEDCGLASPSTLSTVKADLEADGLIRTVPVSQPRGRPRQGLRVGTEELATAEIAELPELVAELRGAEST